MYNKPYFYVNSGGHAWRIVNRGESTDWWIVEMHASELKDEAYMKIYNMLQSIVKDVSSLYNKNPKYADLSMEEFFNKMVSDLDEPYQQISGNSPNST